MMCKRQPLHAWLIDEQIKLVRPFDAHFRRRRLTRAHLLNTIAKQLFPAHPDRHKAR